MLMRESGDLLVVDAGVEAERVERFSSNGDCVLHVLDDSSGLRDWGVIGGYRYLIGGNVASLIPLSGGDPVDSEPWDEVRFLDFEDGVLFVAGRDGSSSVGLSLDPKSDKPQEYDEYDTISAVITVGERVFTTTQRGDVNSLMFDGSIDDQIDEIEYRSYCLIPKYNEPVTASLYEEYMEVTSHLTPTINDPEFEPVTRPLVTEGPSLTTEVMARTPELSNARLLTGWDGDELAMGWSPDDSSRRIDNRSSDYNCYVYVVNVSDGSI